jgi:hypothetical protein
VEVLAERAVLDGRGGVGEGVPELQEVDMEVDVERGGEDRGEEEEGVGRDGNADQRQVGAAGRDEEVGVVLDREQRDADEGEVAEQRQPGGAGDGLYLVDAVDLGAFGIGHRANGSKAMPPR